MPEYAVAFNAFDVPPLGEAIPKKVKGVRGRDRAKVEHTWKNVTRVKEWEDGWYLGYVDDPDDLETLGNLMGHCSGCHYIWACEERIWYFFALFDPEGIPHSTIHAKQATWLNKRHPRDDSEEFPHEVRTWNVQYPSLRHVRDCFKAAGLKYEPGRYKPAHYESCTYDYSVKDPYNDNRETFAYRYGQARCVDTKPQEVDEEVWAVYVKAAKAVEDNYKKNCGSIKVVGRKFKFDGKWLILLSNSDKAQLSAGGSHGKRVAEWLNSLGKGK